ncbi:MAG: class I SAM-dependent methyltransferase [Gammaproteobacteria bacterium]|nr:class I SAM-dependent methyltransferase [Gammaproteobacteria bacterium]MBI5616152.1 class I SAM-dependent methyltransferase [Gammaproteobacteria bacterium]
MTTADDRAGYERRIEGHYAPTDIPSRILECLRAAGREPERLTREDTAAFDEFHGGGRESTRALARFAALEPGLRILDIGSGIGGPARTLAAEFGATVTGIDLTSGFVQAAVLLSGLLGMAHSVDFVHGSALDLPFVDASFDVVWSQNMLMNIEDKPRLFAEIARVLKPGGRFAFEALLEKSGEPLHFPCFWAAEPALSFLLGAAPLRAALGAAGLAERLWEDNTPAVIELGKRRLAAMERGDAPPLGIGVIVPHDVVAKARNVLRNNVEGRTAAIQAVFVRAG